MTAIRRTPAGYETDIQADALPASIVVPAGFTWYVPADLDLSATDVTVNGTVAMPPVPVTGVSVAAASETAAGTVELATQAEVDAGTDAVRAVTPATLAAWPGGGGTVAFDGANIILSDTLDEFRNLLFTLELTLQGAPIETAAIFFAWVIFNDVAFNPFGSNGIDLDDGSFKFSSTSGGYQVTACQYLGTAITGKITDLSYYGAWQVAVALPSGGIVVSNMFTLEPPPPP